MSNGKTGISFDMTAFVQALAVTAEEFDAIAEDLVDTAGDAFVETARASCPVGSPFELRAGQEPGALRDSITETKGRDERGPYVEVEAGGGMGYAGYVEYGTSRQPAESFMRPGMAAAMASLRNEGLSTRSSRSKWAGAMAKGQQKRERVARLKKR